MSFLDRIAECNRCDLSAHLPFTVDGTRVGWVARDIAARLEPFDDVFRLDGGTLVLAPSLTGYAERTRAVDAALRALAGDGLIPGWRGEPYPVGTSFAAPAFFEMERAAVPLFGVRAYGVHVNGFIRDGGGILMWIGRRAGDKPTYPGMLDNMVAGGQPVGISLLDNVIKEAEEEAGVPHALAATARPVGVVTYCTQAEGGTKPDSMFIFDLELPADFTPRNADGEITEFYLWPVEKVIETVAETKEFKFNCNLVNIDFFVRHGLIAPDHPDYVEIVRGLHR